MGGSARRALTFAKLLAREFGYDDREVLAYGDTERYSLYKVGPVISVSHGIGIPSLSILLNEMTKLLISAKAQNPVYIRMGTSGGIGVEPGTVVLTTESISPKLTPVFEQTVMGETRYYPTLLTQNLNDEIYQLRNQLPVTMGKTFSTNSFYEEQMRSDGLFNPSFSNSEKLEFLHKLYEMGVRNIEMESLALSAFCLQAEIPVAVACVTLLDRLKGDQVLASKEELLDYSNRSHQLILSYIKSKIENGAM
jgi:uridine phosphorylase